MNAEDAKLHFPVICFVPDHDLLGARDLGMLTSCTEPALKKDLLAGMEIVDAKLRRFRVRSSKRTGYVGSFPMWFLKGLLYGVQHRIEHDLEALPPISLDELKARARERILTYPETWADADDPDKEVPRRLAGVAAAKTVEDVYDIAVLDDINAY